MHTRQHSVSRHSHRCRRNMWAQHRSVPLCIGCRSYSSPTFLPSLVADMSGLPVFECWWSIYTCTLYISLSCKTYLYIFMLPHQSALFVNSVNKYDHVITYVWWFNFLLASNYCTWVWVNECDLAILQCRVTIFQKNLEMSGNLTTVTEKSGNWRKVGELSGKILSRSTVFLLT